MVSAAEPLVMCPRLIRVVKETGLVCVTYGTLNNESGNVKKQVEQGVDALIVDSVLSVERAVRMGVGEGEGEGDRKKGGRVVEKVEVKVPEIVPVEKIKEGDCSGEVIMEERDE